jgi:hypothetical protein
MHAHAIALLAHDSGEVDADWIVGVVHGSSFEEGADDTRLF